MTNEQNSHFEKQKAQFQGIGLSTAMFGCGDRI